jgi:hypothetical protein
MHSSYVWKQWSSCYEWIWHNKQIILTAFQTSKNDATKNMLLHMYKPMLTSECKPSIANISDCPQTLPDQQEHTQQIPLLLTKGQNTRWSELVWQVGGKNAIQQTFTMDLARMSTPHQSFILKCTKINLQISQQHSTLYIYLE